MENKINLSQSTNAYLQQFSVAQLNFNKLIEEERLSKRMKRNKKRFFKPHE